MLVYILLGMIAFLLIILVWTQMRQPPIVKDLLKQNHELLNRLQAPDLKTFLALQTSSNPIPESDYISQEDEEEARRFLELNGESDNVVLTDEDVRQYSLEDYGMGFNKQ